MEVIKKFLLWVAAAVVFGGLFSFLYAVYLSRNLPTIDEISARQVSQSTKIYDRTGTVLLYEISKGETRTVVPLAEIPKFLQDATIVTEDEKFYEESAFDVKAIIRALFVNALHGKILQGGSTITQQLAKNAFLTSEQTITRKVKELLLAIRLNRHYSKDQILALYLNEIPYGPTIYGVEAASESYFNKSVKDLTLAESALLAALPKAPTYYSPWGSHGKELLGRKDFILKKMLSLGKIKKSEFEEASKFKFSFAPQRHGIKAPHFVMEVQEYLARKYGEEKTRTGGLRVVSTLDWNLQQAAEKAVEDGAKNNEKLYNGKNAALVAEDPKTGQILAMVGSRDYFDAENEGTFNVATQGLRQPGSTLKPFVYYTAFTKGYSPDTVVFDVPTEFAAKNPACPPSLDFKNSNNECFHPENFDDKFRGPVALRQALAQSINIPAVKMLYLAGLNDSVKNAYTFGMGTLTSPNLYGLSLVLGGGAVKLIDLVGAYSALAQNGVKHPQVITLEVKDHSGSTLESYEDRGNVVADSQAARLINNILSDSNSRSGLFQNSLYLTVFPDRDVALKTGTSNDYRDAWTVGYTPSLVVGVWAGNNDNSPMQRHGSSILAAVPIWNAFFAEAIKNLPLETFTRPDPVYPQKSILRGDYSSGKQIHSILYYVDKKDPLGPQPADPGLDPQFENWETGVVDWAKKNIPDFQDYNKPIMETENQLLQKSNGPRPQVTIQAPAPGSFIGEGIDISARLESGAGLKRAIIYWNGRGVQEFSLNPASLYELRWSFAPPEPQAQNLLEVEAYDEKNFSGKSGVIVYHENTL